MMTKKRNIGDELIQSMEDAIDYMGGKKKHAVAHKVEIPENIDISSVCTYCQADKYFSYRKDKSEPVQAMMIVAGME